MTAKKKQFKHKRIRTTTMPEVGRRVNIWLPPEALYIWQQLDNGSAFVQLALKDCVGIMTWDILKNKSNYKDRGVRTTPETMEKVVPKWNEMQKRRVSHAALKKQKQEQECGNSPTLPELW